MREDVTIGMTDRKCPKGHKNYRWMKVIQLDSWAQLKLNEC